MPAGVQSGCREGVQRRFTGSEAHTAGSPEQARLTTGTGKAEATVSGSTNFVLHGKINCSFQNAIWGALPRFSCIRAFLRRSLLGNCFSKRTSCILEDTCVAFGLGCRGQGCLPGPGFHCLFSLLQLNVVNSGGLSEDIKPLPGLPGIGSMNHPSSSPGSLVKHICAICGDRSSGA